MYKTQLQTIILEITNKNTVVRQKNKFHYVIKIAKFTRLGQCLHPLKPTLITRQLYVEISILVLLFSKLNCRKRYSNQLHSYSKHT